VVSFGHRARGARGQTIFSKSKATFSRDAWEKTVATFTQLCRLHRIRNRLSAEARRHLDEALHEFENSVQGKDPARRFLSWVPHLLPSMIDKARGGKQQFAFGWYKVLSMCTHTPTSAAPLFAGQAGVLKQGLAVDDVSWREAFTAVAESAKMFVVEAELLLGSVQSSKADARRAPTSGALGQRVRTLPKARSRWLRTLNNICYVSTCLMLMTLAFDERDGKRQEIVDVRTAMQQCVVALVKAGVLLAGPDDDEHAGWAPFIHKEFWTDEYDARKWELHLVAGVFLLFWHLR